jgi:hypothetical protein
MAWWMTGSIVSAILGAFGGLFIGGILAAASSLIVANHLHDAGWEWAEYLITAVMFICVVGGTAGGALLGARARRRRTA